jgi:SAM-dependent methyltransferase
MNSEEYGRMHELETHYWWFVGRRVIVDGLLREVAVCRAASHAAMPLRLLDIGCGTGANLPMLRAAAGTDGRVVGMDFSALALDFARTHLDEPNSDAASPVNLLQGDALRLPFPDAAFDIVTMLDVLEHLEDDAGALREVRRVLRPGGAYVWSVPAYQHLWSAHDEALHHFRRYERRCLAQLLRRSGFRVHRLSFAMSLMPPLAWFWRRFVLPFQPRRPREAKRHSQGAVLPQLPPPLNAAMIRYLQCEGRLIARRPLQFGTSLVGVAFKK